jgi:PAS domain S-box-containing protein
MSPDLGSDPNRRLVYPLSEPDPPPSPSDDSPQAYRVDIEQVRHILPQLIDALADAVLVVDAEHRVVAANRRYIQAFGLHRRDAVGVLCHEALHCPEAGKDANPSGCAACDVLTLKESRRMVRALPDEAGVLRRWEVTLNPVLGEGGAVTHVVEVWRDITARSQLESQLSHSERLASLGMLAAGVAHEINNPMASIVAGVESLRRWLNRAQGLGAEDAAEMDEVLGVLERETQRSRETTDKLLLLAQPMQVAAGWVDLNRAARDTLSLLRYQTRMQDVTVVEDLDPQLPAIWGRESGMRGVMMNLCMNAVQAMSEGGTLTVRTRHRADNVTIEVIDTGPGIHPAHLERIWDPFFTTKPVGKGTGLGLSITQRVLARHAGRVRVESTLGQGARFIIELPIAGPGGENV